MRRLLFLVLMVLVGVSGFAQSGTCGEDLTWELENGVLTISGTGGMEDYGGGWVPPNPVPWYSYREEIIAVIVESGVESIGMSAFEECRSLASITIPASVTSIGYIAFQMCSSLESITLPEALISIGNSAFNACGLVGEINIPKSVEHIGTDVFHQNFSLTSIHVDAENEHYCSVDGIVYSKLQDAVVVCPNGKAGSIVILNGVTTIEPRAFSKCWSITAVTIPEGVETIGEYAFFDCQQLSEITIPASVTFIGENGPFSACDALLAIHVNEDNLNYSSVDGVLYNKIQDTLIVCPGGKNELIIPHNITAIAKDAFTMSQIRTLTLPASLAQIESYAFNSCRNLTDIMVNWITTPPVINSDAFIGLTLSNITLYVPAGTKAIYKAAEIWKEFKIVDQSNCPSGTFGADVALAWELCEGTITISGTGEMPNLNRAPWYLYREDITTAIVESGVENIGNGAFYECRNLESIALPESVISIGDQAFLNCSRLESIIISKSVISIGEQAFYGCNRLESITLPEKVNFIGGGAFYGCSSLTSITIPESVTSIGNGAFSYCSDLTDITVNWTTTPPAINGNALTLRNIILYVPEGTTAIYETAEVWKEFTIVEQSNCPSGTFGTNDALTWKLCEGTITISGTGEMPGFGYQDFDTDLPPWHSYKRIITAVVVESGVESIGSFAFYGYDNLESITLPESVSSIRRYAFSRSNGLASVIIPETVTSIGEFAFWDCTRLTEITVASDNPSYCSEAGVLFDKEKTTLIQYPGGKTGSYTVPESVTSIGDCAFMYCYSLEAVSLSKNVNSIGRQAFYGCSGLTSVTFPASVTSIENGAFTNCSNLIEMTVDANNSSFSSEDGVLFDKSKATLLQYPTGRTDDSYTIPASVTAIGNDAFSYCTGLKSIILPEMLTSIGNDAFFGCSSLTSITLPATVTSIENYAFYGNNSLTDVIVNWTTTPLEINTHVFAYLTLSNITLHVPYGTTAIYEAAEIWKEFDIVEQPCPSGTFGDGDALAWELCEGTLTISGVGVMPDYDSSNNRSPWYSYREEITDVIIESGVESIGAWAFHGCRQLQSVGLFPASLLNAIGEAAFHGCRSLKSVTLPEALTSIGEAAFVSCVSLESIIIPEKVNFIGNSAFVDCSGLKSIIIPESVTSIGEAAFYRCGSLESIILPESLTSIGVAAFSESNSLTEITVASNNPAFSSEGGVLFDKNKETIIQYPIGKTNNSYTIPESVTSIEPHAFAYCRLEYITIPESVTSIERNAFAYCRLEYITIPESVTSIERWTFAYSYNLKSITIPESVTSIGTLALAGCSKLADITVNWTATPPAINSDVFYELTLSNITLHVPAGTTAIYEAAEVWSGFTIVEQSNNCPSGTFGANDALAWELCDGTLAISGSGAMPDYGYDNPAPWVSHREDILAVVIESGVERIGVWSFGLCIYLESIIIPESVTSIGYSAFLDCHRLKSVTLPEALTSIEAATFGACGSLESIIIPEKVNSIGKEAFYGCVSLTSITIPASVTSIGVAVFGECHRLTEIAVASNNPAFSSEGGVLFDKNKETIIQYPKGKVGDSYIVPETVIFIGEQAFRVCSSLKSIIIPESVTSIGSNAFDNCYNLTDMTVNWTATPPAINSNVFLDLTLSNITLHVPAKTKAIYEATEVWKEFTIADPFTGEWGTFGEGNALTWELYEGTLTLSGTGAIPGYAAGTQPWASYLEEIRAVVIESGITALDASALEGCNGLTDITVASNHPSFGSEDGVLFDRSGATLIRYPVGKSGTAYAIPAAVTAIEDYAFADCSQLSDMTVGWTATPPAISSNVFNNLTLSDITLNVPAKTRGIYEAAEVWKAFTIVDPYPCEWGVFGANDALTWELCEGTLTISGTGAIPAATMDRSLPWYAYREDITTLVIESGVQSIGMQAFLQYGSLASVTLPASLTAIGQYAFAFCNRLAAIALPASTTTLGDGALASCERLAEINVSSNNPSYSSLDGVLFNKSRTTLLQYPAAKADDSYTLPASVTAIGNSAFISCRRLESITIPASVTAIGSNAFTDCIGLSSITVGWTTTPPAINSNVFSGLTLSDLQLHVPSKTRAIYEAAAIWREFHIVDPSGCYSGTFGAGSSLTWELCDGLLVISGTGAMPDYGNLMAISAMGTAANASGNLPPWYAYREEITDVVIEAGVTSIGSGSFEGCDHLTDVTVNWTDVPPAITVDAFSGLDLSTITLHVPDDAESLYGDAEVWKEFNIVKQSVGIQVVSRGLKVYVQDGVLHVGGLAVGEAWGVYDVSGRLMHQRVANGGEAMIYLKVRGVYIVRTENRSVKTVY